VMVLPIVLAELSRVSSLTIIGAASLVCLTDARNTLETLLLSIFAVD
jgi:hypothetical protein